MRVCGHRPRILRYILVDRSDKHDQVSAVGRAFFTTLFRGGGTTPIGGGGGVIADVAITGPPVLIFLAGIGGQGGGMANPRFSRSFSNLVCRVARTENTSHAEV